MITNLFCAECGAGCFKLEPGQTAYKLRLHRDYPYEQPCEACEDRAIKIMQYDVLILRLAQETITFALMISKDPAELWKETWPNRPVPAKIRGIKDKDLIQNCVRWQWRD